MITIYEHLSINAFGTVIPYVRVSTVQAVPAAGDRLALWGTYADGEAELWPVQGRVHFPDAALIQLVPMYLRRTLRRPPEVSPDRPPLPHALPWDVEEGDPEARLRAAGWVGIQEHREAVELAQRRTFAPTADEFEAWLKRQRDDYEQGGGGPQHRDAGYWALDGALDDYRLHGVTGTPLTEPTPTEGHHDE